MAGKKAAKKAAAKKSAAKKTPAKKMAAKHAGHGSARDLRRAYEHMGRLEAMGSLLSTAATGEIQELLRFAESSLAAEDAKSGADILRAGEHLAFGSLAVETGDNRASEELQAEALNECEDLLERAAEHWDRHKRERVWPLDTAYKHARAEAEHSLRRGALRRALEYARAAEALGHVRGAPVALPAARDKHPIAN